MGLETLSQTHALLLLEDGIPSLKDQRVDPGRVGGEIVREADVYNSVLLLLEHF